MAIWDEEEGNSSEGDGVEITESDGSFEEEDVSSDDSLEDQSQEEDW